MSIRLATALLAFSVSAPALAQGQLPTGVTPKSYDITIRPDAANLKFSGTQTVAVDVAKPTRTIVLNAAELTDVKATFDGRAVTDVKMDAAAQTLTLTLPTAATAGAHRIGFEWKGTINTSAAGLFAVDYPDAKGGEARMLATQFEAPDARRFAPMWDEPAYKAKFTLSVVAPDGQTAFSNMPAASVTKQGDGTSLYRFAETPVMSSYLLFMGMGDIERKTRKVGDVEIGVITRRGVSDQGDYALEAAAKLLPWYENYFGVKYPLPKLDMIAAPGSSQFFGAMENWGAILYFEPLLLFDPQRSAQTDRQAIFGVVAHEMAHQWFGNIVTMRWWDDLWLNEGFASWIGDKATGDLNPAWKMDVQTVANNKEAAIGLDARETTHPIIQPVRTPDQISEAFDAITYSKGQVVIGMLEKAAGPAQFRQGVQRYIKRYAYSNTVTDQLWAEVDAVAPTKISDIAHDFTLQAGVPMINVANPACAGGKGQAGLSQTRFALDASGKIPTTWRVPVAVGNPGGAAQTLTVSGAKPQAVTTPACGAIVANMGQGSYARVRYDAAAHDALVKRFGSLAAIDQVGIIGDDHALALAGDAPLDAYLAAVGATPADADPILWAVIAGQLTQIANRFTGTPIEAKLRAKVAAILAPPFRRVGFEKRAGEPPNDEALREVLVAALGANNDAQVAARARRDVAALRSNGAQIPAGIRRPILDAYATSATAADWEALRALAKAETNPLARSEYVQLLGAARDETLARRALALTLTDELTSPQKASLLVAVGRAHPELAFDFAVANLDAVYGFVEASSRSGYVVGLANGSTDPKMPAKVRAFAESKLDAGSRAPADRIVNGLTVRNAIRQRIEPAVTRWVAAK